MGSVPYGVVLVPSSIRSLLFVPGDSAAKLEKAKGIAVDALIFDWDDAVLDAHKAKARETTTAALRSREAYPQPILIRVNPVASEAFAADCEALAACPADAAMLPKCGSPVDIRALEQRLRPAMGIFAVIETPLGVLQAPAIASCSARMRGLLFGAEDYSAETGIERSTDEAETLYARSATVTAARAYGLEAFDSPAMDYRNMEALRASTRRGRRLGFSGRAAIHPNQIAIIEEAYTPSGEEAAKARATLERFRSAGAGAVGMDGRLVDEPILRQARRILARFDRRRRASGGEKQDSAGQAEA